MDSKNNCCAIYYFPYNAHILWYFNPQTISYLLFWDSGYRIRYAQFWMLIGSKRHNYLVFFFFFRRVTYLCNHWILWAIRETISYTQDYLFASIFVISFEIMLAVKEKLNVHIFLDTPRKYHLQSHYTSFINYTFFTLKKLCPPVGIQINHHYEQNRLALCFKF